MQNLANLFNQALTASGHASVIADPTEKSKVAAMCRLWFAPARRSVFTAALWPSLRSVSRLTVATYRRDNTIWTAGDPLPGYKYCYGLPSNCLRPRYLSTFEKFELHTRNDETVISSNAEGAMLEYTIDVENPGLWESDLYNAVVYSLAASINMAGSGKGAITNMLSEKVEVMIERAAVSEANSDDGVYFDSAPSFYAGAFSTPAQMGRFLYPNSSFRVAGGI